MLADPLRTNDLVNSWVYDTYKTIYLQDNL